MGLSDAESAVRPAAEAGDLAGRKPSGSYRAGLASVGLQHAPPPSERSERHHPDRQSIGALTLLIDNTGIKAEGEVVWFVKKHRPSKPSQWQKVHLRNDADTLGIRSIAVIGSRVCDARMLPDQILDGQPIAKISAGGAYHTLGCHAAIAAPAPKTARPWLENTPGAPARNDPAALAAPTGHAGAAITDEA